MIDAGGARVHGGGLCVGDARDAYRRFQAGEDARQIALSALDETIISEQNINRGNEEIERIIMESSTNQKWESQRDRASMICAANFPKRCFRCMAPNQSFRPGQLRRLVSLGHSAPSPAAAGFRRPHFQELPVTVRVLDASPDPAVPEQLVLSAQSMALRFGSKLPNGRSHCRRHTTNSSSSPPAEFLERHPEIHRRHRSRQAAPTSQVEAISRHHRAENSCARKRVLPPALTMAFFS